MPVKIKEVNENQLLNQMLCGGITTRTIRSILRTQNANIRLLHTEGTRRLPGPAYQVQLLHEAQAGARPPHCIAHRPPPPACNHGTQTLEDETASFV